MQWDSPWLLFNWVTEVFCGAKTQNTAKFALIICVPPKKLKWRPVPPKHPESPQGSWEKWRNEVQSLNPFQVLECSSFSAQKGDPGTITFSFVCFPLASQQSVGQQLWHSPVCPHLCLLSRVPIFKAGLLYIPLPHLGSALFPWKHPCVPFLQALTSFALMCGGKHGRKRG